MSKKAISGWKKSATYNPANGDCVQFNKIATQFSELPDDRNIKTETSSGSAYGGKSYPLTLGFIDDDGLPLLESWMVGVTLVNLVIFAPAGFSILFYENETMDVNPGVGVNARDGAVVNRLMMEHTSGKPDIHEVKNLAKPIDFEDESGELVFPISGVTLTLAADYDAPAGANLIIEAKDFSGTVLADSSTAVSAGRNSVEITLPADTYSLDIDLLDGGTGTVTEVSLRGDGSSEYINY